VLAHSAPAQLLRLVRRLSSPQSSFFVHVDRAAGDDVLRPIRDGLSEVPRAQLVRRHATSWGSFGLVAAPLEALAAARGTGFDVAVLLSAQDYPVRQVAKIEEWLGARSGRSFMSHFSIPTEHWADGGLQRFDRWYWHGRILGRFVMFPHPRLPWLPTWRRKLVPGMTFYGGSAWWGLSGEAAEYVLDFTRSSRRFVRFFRHVDHPDESYFQTVLLNSPLAGSIEDDDLHYVDWSARGSRPMTLGEKDLETVLASGELFARKFDDPAVLDLIDERVHGGAA